MNKQKLAFISMITRLWYLHRFSNDVATFIACQLALESNFGTSELAVFCDNYSGMKSPVRRINVCSKVDKDFATYSFLGACVVDYLLWLSWNHFTVQEMSDLPLFVAHLKRADYCPEVDYIDRVQRIYDDVVSELKTY